MVDLLILDFSSKVINVFNFMCIKSNIYNDEEISFLNNNNNNYSYYYKYLYSKNK